NPAPRLPPELVGSPNTTAPGVPRLWNVARALFFEQALFSQPAAGGPPTGIDTVFLSWGEHRGQGGSVAAALRNLLPSGGNAPRAGRGADPPPPPPPTRRSPRGGGRHSSLRLKPMRPSPPATWSGSARC